VGKFGSELELPGSLASLRNDFSVRVSHQSFAMSNPNDRNLPSWGPPQFCQNDKGSSSPRSSGANAADAQWREIREEVADSANFAIDWSQLNSLQPSSLRIAILQNWRRPGTRRDRRFEKFSSSHSALENDSSKEHVESRP